MIKLCKEIICNWIGITETECKKTLAKCLFQYINSAKWVDNKIELDLKD